MTPNATHPDNEHACSPWPGFPFPPPMMGLSAPTVNAASSHWLLTVAAMLETGMNLSTVFASAPAELALRRFALPDISLPVVTGAGMYALGAVTPAARAPCPPSSPPPPPSTATA